MAITEQFLLGYMVNAVPSSACDCRKGGSDPSFTSSVGMSSGLSSLPVPKKAPDSPNPINRNRASVSTSTTHGSLMKQVEKTVL